MTINLLSCVNYYVEDMVTFNAMANFYSIEYYTANVAELGEVKFFVQQKCLSIYTIHLSIDTHTYSPYVVLHFVRYSSCMPGIVPHPNPLG